MSQLCYRSNGNVKTGRVSAALLIALVAGSCTTLCPIFFPPHFDPVTLDGLNSIGTDSKTLFAQLEQPSPACQYSSNSAQFDKTAADITTVSIQAAKTQNNGRTQNGVGDLTKSLSSFRSADEGGGAACLPANIVKDEETSFGAAVSGLINYENQKPKGS